ncbi:tRNA (adenine(22)-N(1))-methyltransferase [Virgibacillus oceani]|uniref:SAM-dependent methyltransferase n=1 Tax=Virgibacillus oceani TaxID=1479511 RepID=A0A917H0I9_9BACI|nr:tRNA (adenine(22)-N(1))-methyltransferase TrmK [Virgibacillus oceani]GGG63499.1 SAM-dependent methyltransferase [Virgibacillus oceani]
MSNNFKLSKRLTRVAAYLPAGALFADIGSDHAYLPCYVCLLDNNAKAIAGEVNAGPYDSARETVNHYKLTQRIDVRLGNGLEVVKQGEIKQLVIAGMGGSLIRSILEDGEDKFDCIERIITQPNVDAKNVRSWMMKNNYTITSEEVIEENGHFYEIIVGDVNTSGNISRLTDKKLFFGPLLLQNKTNAFYRKWEREQNKLQFVIEQLKQAKIPNDVKLEKFQTELEWIREELQDDKYNP